MDCNRVERSYRRFRELGEEVEIGVVLFILVWIGYYVVDIDNLLMNYRESLRRFELVRLKSKTVGRKRRDFILLFWMLFMNV